MDADQLAETTMDPRHRTLRRINLGDLEAAEQVFDLLMGNEVAPAQGVHLQFRGDPGPLPHRRLGALGLRRPGRRPGRGTAPGLRPAPARPGHLMG